MKKILFLVMILSIVAVTTGCMSMRGLGGMHHHMSAQNMQSSDLRQKGVFQNEELSLSLMVPPFYSGVTSSMEFSIAYKSKRDEKSNYRLILSVQEAGSDSVQTVAFATEGTFQVDYLPRAVGVAEISVNFSGEKNEKLIRLLQKISDRRNDSFFSNPETYIWGGLFMGSMMAVMLLVDWH